MGIFATPSYTGLTGGIDFPNAYILIDKNYTISGIVGTIDGDVQADFVIESNLLPQVEAGIKISTLQKEFSDKIVDLEKTKTHYLHQISHSLFKITNGLSKM